MDILINFKHALLNNWHFMRWLRLGLGLFIAFQAVKNLDAISGLIAGFFLFQAITNTGCCGSGGCDVPASTQKQSNVEEVDFEEIKSTPK